MTYPPNSQENHFNRYLRQHRLSLEELSVNSGVLLKSLREFTSGVAVPSLKTAQKIAKALKCDVNDLWPLEQFGAAPEHNSTNAPGVSLGDLKDLSVAQLEALIHSQDKVLNNQVLACKQDMTDESFQLCLEHFSVYESIHQEYRSRSRVNSYISALLMRSRDLYHELLWLAWVQQD